MAAAGCPVIFRVDQALVGTARTVELLALIRNAAVRNHTLWFVEHVQAEGGDVTAAWDQLGGLVGVAADEVQTLHEAVLRIRPHAATLGAVTVGVQAGANAGACSSCNFVMELPNAIRLSAAPLAVLVEDIINDVAFLARALPRPWQKWLQESQERGAVAFEHGGGKRNLKNFVDHFGSGTRRDPAGLGPAAWCVAHIVLVDRDMPAAPQEGATQSEIRALLRSRGHEERIWVLQRRSADHYVPLAMLDELHASGLLQTPAMKRVKAARLAGDKIADKSVKLAFATQPSSPGEDAWFDDDGSREEMTQIAEWISAHL